MDPERTAVREVMTEEVFTCPAGSDALVACTLMEEKQVRRLVVMDDGCVACRHRLPGRHRAPSQAREGGQCAEESLGTGVSM